MRGPRLQNTILLFLCLCVASTFWLLKLLYSANNSDRTRLSEPGDRTNIVSVHQRFGLSLLPRGKVSSRAGGPARVAGAKNKKTSLSRGTQPWMFPRPWSELEHNAVPNNVFFVWCENRTFTFNDHLSVLSAWKLLEPDTLEIHQGADIRTDKYNQWFLQLNGTVPALTVTLVKHRNICRNPLYYALEVLSDRGGVFLNFSTALVRPVHFLRKKSFSAVLDVHGDVAFIASEKRHGNLRHVLVRPDDQGQRLTLARLKEKLPRSDDACPSVLKTVPLSVSGGEAETSNRTCVTLSSSLVLTPLDLWETPDPTLAVLRDVFYIELHLDTDQRYPSEEEAEVEREGETDTHHIPFVVHYAWFGAQELSFVMYLSFLSTVHVAKVHRVFIHSDLHLTGHYWRTVSAHPKVTVVYREAPLHIYGRRILYTQHRSDILRADVLDKYGGIYIDWDVLWLRSPEPLLQRQRAGSSSSSSSSSAAAVVNLDHMAQQPFAEVLNLGVFLAGPRSRFVRLWRWELRNYRTEDFFYNALELPYKVYERHPDTVLVEKRLQVMCFRLLCHPIVHPDHKNWLRAQPFDWKTDVYSIHFTYPDPAEFESIVSLVNASGTFADIGKFILNEAKELEVT